MEPPTYWDEKQTIITKVVCIHGKHRIHAARRFLPVSDQWWIAKVFDSGKRFFGSEASMD